MSIENNTTNKIVIDVKTPAEYRQIMEILQPTKRTPAEQAKIEQAILAIRRAKDKFD